MKQHLPKAAYLLLCLIPFACKTVSRDGFDSNVSQVSVKMPAGYEAKDAKVSFTRLDTPSAPRVVKGKDLSIKLPTGKYSVDLVVLDESGTEVYKSCDSSKAYSLNKAKETVAIELCESGPNGNGTPVNPSGPGEPVVPVGPVNPPVGPVTAVEPPAPELPKFSMGEECFGLPSTASVEGNELVIKLSGELKDKALTLATFLRCSVRFAIPKGKDMMYSPFPLRIAYEADEKTTKQNIFIKTDGRDASNNLIVPCETIFINSNANSRKALVCSFFEPTTDAPSGIIKRRAAFDSSCALASSEMTFTITIGGTNSSYFYSLKIPEIRIQIPQVEACHL